MASCSCRRKKRLRSPSQRWPRQTSWSLVGAILWVSFSCICSQSSAIIAWLFCRTFIPYLICISCMFLFICEVKHTPIRSSVYGVWTGWIIRYVQTWPPKNMCCLFRWKRKLLRPWCGSRRRVPRGRCGPWLIVSKKRQQNWKVGPYDRYKWNLNPFKWPYKWVNGVMTTMNGVTILFITGRGPPCTNAHYPQWFNI